MRDVIGRLFSRTETTLAVVILAFGAVFSLAAPHFLTLANWLDLVESNSITFILAAGVMVVLVSGGIDISFAATTAATQYVAAFLASRLGLSPWLSLGLACGLGVAMGALNALLTYWLRVVSIIVTIATSSVYYALLIYLTDGKEIYDLPDWWTHRVVLAQFAVSGETLRITLPVLVLVVAVVATHLLMSRTGVGRQIYALGGNPEAAARVGIDVLRIQLFAYGYLGLLAAVAGFVQAHRMAQAVPTAMAGTELGVLAVAILGGASLVGGIGSMGGVVLGVVLLAMLQNGLNLLGVSSYFFRVVTGAAILVAVTVTAHTERRMLHRSRQEPA